MIGLIQWLTKLVLTYHVAEVSEEDHVKLYSDVSKLSKYSREAILYYEGRLYYVVVSLIFYI